MFDNYDFGFGYILLAGALLGAAGLGLAYGIFRLICWIANHVTFV